MRFNSTSPAPLLAPSIPSSPSQIGRQHEVYGQPRQDRGGGEQPPRPLRRLRLLLRLPHLRLHHLPLKDRSRLRLGGGIQVQLNERRSDWWLDRVSSDQCVAATFVFASTGEAMPARGDLMMRCACACAGMYVLVGSFRISASR
jgi:hypothetical protein